MYMYMYYYILKEINVTFNQFNQERFHRDNFFGGSWRLMRDLANVWSLNGCLMVSVLWKGGFTGFSWKPVKTSTVFAGVKAAVFLH